MIWHTVCPPPSTQPLPRRLVFQPDYRGWLLLLVARLLLAVFLRPDHFGKYRLRIFKCLGFFADNPTPRPETGLMKFWNPIPKFQFSHLFLKKCESNPIQAFPTCPGFEGSMIAVGCSALPCFTELVALSIPLLPAKGFTLLDWLDDQKEIIIAARLVSQTLHLQIWIWPSCCIPCILRCIDRLAKKRETLFKWIFCREIAFKFTVFATLCNDQ